ncbi:MAG: hypothetical protein C0592_13865 [Marinilabiliales bacterium]|nr:MAG: hypothetical protein C0592_13865 [Marinilabiliales bacterium]
MKKISVLVVFALLLGFGKMSFAQENAIKLNIFSLAIGTYNVAYERAINDMNTAQLGVFYLNWGTGSGDYKTTFTGLGITPEFRHYFDESLYGFYVAPFLRIQSYTLSQDYDDIDTLGNFVTRTAKGNLMTFGGGVVAGHQWVLGEHFTIDLFLGPQYSAGTAKVSDDSDDPDYEFSTGAFSGFGIRWGMTFGFAF